MTRCIAQLIAVAPVKKVTSHFAIERVKSSTAYPLPPELARGRGAARDPA
jgi:hypothetical protein